MQNSKDYTGFYISYETGIGNGDEMPEEAYQEAADRSLAFLTRRFPGAEISVECFGYGILDLGGLDEVEEDHDALVLKLSDMETAIEVKYEEST